MAGAIEAAQVAVQFQVAFEPMEGLVQCLICPLYIENSQNAKDAHYKENHLVNIMRFTKPKFAPAKSMVKNSSAAATTKGPSTVERTQKKQQTKNKKKDKQLNEAIAKRAAARN